MSTSSNSTLPPLDRAQRYSVEEAIRYLRSSRATIYKDIREGKLLTIVERSRRYIPGSEIVRRSKKPAAAKASAS